MATYIVLASLTDQGVRTMQDLRKRLENARATFASYGAELKQLYFAMGQYDYVIIAEAPDDEALRDVVGDGAREQGGADDEAMTRVSLAVSAQGNVRTNSFRGFTEDETVDLVEGLH